MQKNKSKISSFFSFFNIFTNPFHFYINSEENLTSRCGNILTFLIFLLLIYMFATSDMIHHKNPKISDQIIANKAPSVTINNRNFAPVVMLYEFFGNFSSKFVEIDPSYFNITVGLFSSISDKTKPIKNFALHECVSADFNHENKYKEYYEGGYCFLERNESIDLSGQRDFWFGNVISLAITVKICSNETYNNSCKPLNEILDFAKGKYFSLTVKPLYFHIGACKKISEKKPIINYLTCFFFLNKKLYKNIKYFQYEIY